MQISIPIYVQSLKSPSGTQYIASPLFGIGYGAVVPGMRRFTDIHAWQEGSGFSAPASVRSHHHVRGSELGRVLATLAAKLRRYATDNVRNMTNDIFYSLHQPEQLNSAFRKIRVDLRDRSYELKLLFVSFPCCGTEFAFSPSIPDQWFEVKKDEHWLSRSIEVYQEYFRKRRAEDSDFEPSRYSVAGKAWLDTIELSIPRLPVRKPKARDGLAALFGHDVSDGSEQLNQVGRCLDALDIDDLTDPANVEAQMRELDTVLSMPQPRSVVLVGPAGSGKTALIQGWVRRRRMAERKPRIKKLVYELSSSRLISGMSYLGQWESRVTGIIKFANRMQHILYFNDFLGLYRAGVTRDSKYSVADLIRGQRDRNPVRIIAELTDEAWAILREKDAGLAGQFTVIRMPTLDEEQSLPVLQGVIRKLELRYRCRFDLEALPEVVRLYDRFVRDSVLPGKAVDALRRLAISKSNEDIRVDDVQEEFHRRTGLAKRLLNSDQRLDRETIEGNLGERLIGQPQAVRAMADRVLVTAARMNETSRPLGVLLFLGPTGVGKTEAAKCIADYLYGEEGLLRIDMNELSGPTAAATMLGTFDAPEGRLTGAVRQRPFCVVLLDEIEKAHPAVLDVLLQALGEARMTDALGRTVDLSGTVIIMTSNLGADQARRRVGFSGADEGERFIRLKAVRDFFRPEFVNRIDEIVHFGPLSNEDVQKIATIQLESILRRDGLVRRRTILDVDPSVLQWAVNQGFDATQGARAIKRALERYLVDRAAPQLVGLDAGATHLVQIRPGQDTPLDVSVRKVEEMIRQTPLVSPSAEETLTRAQREIVELEGKLPKGATSIIAGSSQQTILEFTLKDAYRTCVESIRTLASALEPSELSEAVAMPSIKQVRRLHDQHGRILSRVFTEIGAVEDIRAYIRDASTQTSQTLRESAAEAVRRSLRQLHRYLDCQNPIDPCEITIRTYGRGSDAGMNNHRNHSGDDLGKAITRSLAKFLRDKAGFDAVISSSKNQVRICISGILSNPIVDELMGVWLWLRLDGSMQLIEVNKERQAADTKQSSIPLRFLAYSGGPAIDLKTGIVFDRFEGDADVVNDTLMRFWEAISHVA